MLFKIIRNDITKMNTEAIVNAVEVFDWPDDMKLKSSMTLLLSDAF